MVDDDENGGGLTVRDVENRSLDTFLGDEKHAESEQIMPQVFESVSAQPEFEVPDRGFSGVSDSVMFASEDLASTKRKPKPKCHIDKRQIIQMIHDKLCVNGQENIIQKIRFLKSIEYFLGLLLLLCLLTLFLVSGAIMIFVDGKIGGMVLLASFISTFCVGIGVQYVNETYTSLYSKNIVHPLLSAYFSAQDLPNLEKTWDGNLANSLKPFHPVIKSIVASLGHRGQYRECVFECYLDLRIEIKPIDKDNSEYIKGQLYVLPLKRELPYDLYITERSFKYTTSIQGAKEFKTNNGAFNQRFRLELYNARGQSSDGFIRLKFDSEEVLRRLQRMFDHKMLQTFVDFDQMADSDTMMMFLRDKLYIIHLNDRELYKVPDIGSRKYSIENLIEEACDQNDQICKLLDLLYDQTGDLLA